MTGKGAVLAGRILAELRELSVLVQRAEHGWVKARESHDDYFLDGVALNLHGFYSGLERIFERIASGVEESVPVGANWHQELLSQMAIEIPAVRPAVISAGLKEELEPYRGFRHVVRNVYAYHLSPEKMEPLVEKTSCGIFDCPEGNRGFWGLFAGYPVIAAPDSISPSHLLDPSSSATPSFYPPTHRSPNSSHLQLALRPTSAIFSLTG